MYVCMHAVKISFGHGYSSILTILLIIGKNKERKIWFKSECRNKKQQENYIPNITCLIYINYFKK